MSTRTSNTGQYGSPRSVFASANSSGSVTPSDATELNFKCLWIGVTGDVAIKHTATGATVTYKNVPVGELHVEGVRVMAATTATEIIWMNW